MTPMRLLLLATLLTGISVDAIAQAIQFPAESVSLRTSLSGITLSGLRTPDGTLPPLSLQATIPAVSDETVIVIGGRESDRLVKAPSVRTFIGRIGDDLQSTVTITYVGENLFGLIQHSDGTTWIVTRNLDEETYSVMSGKDHFSLPDCGFRDEGSISDVKHSSAQPASTGLRELELAVETDSEFFKNTGADEQKAIDYLAALMSNVSSLYQKELGIVIKVVWARIWTNAPSDPYGVAGNPFALSDAVIANWQSYDTVERDLFHAITASGGGGGGYAFPDAICRTESHAHGATSVQGWTDLSAPGFNYDIYIVSHEIGHNFNARHTHSCYYGAPLDTCEVEQGIQEGCLQPGQVKLPNPGSIMSYCGWTNLGAGFGYTVEMGFRDTVRSAMQSYSTSQSRELLEKAGRLAGLSPELSPEF